jgi:hypothetical protein
VVHYKSALTYPKQRHSRFSSTYPPSSHLSVATERSSSSVASSDSLVTSATVHSSATGLTAASSLKVMPSPQGTNRNFGGGTGKGGLRYDIPKPVKEEGSGGEGGRFETYSEAATSIVSGGEGREDKEGRKIDLEPIKSEREPRRKEEREGESIR